MPFKPPCRGEGGGGVGGGAPWRRAVPWRLGRVIVAGGGGEANRGGSGARRRATPRSRRRPGATPKPRPRDPAARNTGRCGGRHLTVGRPVWQIDGASGYLTGQRQCRCPTRAADGLLGGRTEQPGPSPAAPTAATRAAPRTRAARQPHPAREAPRSGGPGPRVQPSVNPARAMPRRARRALTNAGGSVQPITTSVGL